MKKSLDSLAPLLLLLAALFPSAAQARQTPQPAVNAVLFYSPTCPHCHKVINETLVPMIEQYGGRLQIVGIDVTTPQGRELFLSALKTFNLKEAGVPFLVIDDIYLIGSADIPEKFPALVEEYLKQGGVDFPDIPGLREVLPPPEPTFTPQPPPAPEQTAAPTQPPAPTLAAVQPQFKTSADLTWQERFAQDRAGNSLAVFVLAGMLGASGWTFLQFPNGKKISINEKRYWALPVLALLGAGVAAYLAYVETAEVAAVCGPVGDCNSVQQSEYARLFGILPIGVLGLAGYALFFLTWLIARFRPGRLAHLAALALFGISVLGTLFSIYLTFLEPFVIGATCMWCLTSAAIMTALMALTVFPANFAWQALNSLRD